MLVANLIEHFDFEVVCSEVWQHIYSWYSADFCIPRTLKKDRFNNNKIYLDIYPEDSFEEDSFERESNNESEID